MDYGLALFLRSKDVKLKVCKNKSVVGVPTIQSEFMSVHSDYQLLTTCVCQPFYSQPKQPNVAVQQRQHLELSFAILFLDCTLLESPFQITNPIWSKIVKGSATLKGIQGVVELTKKREVSPLDGIPTLPPFWSLCFASLSFFL